MARPKIKLTELRKDWKTFIVRDMADGASQAEITAGLEISNDLFYRFMKEEPEFSETIKKGLVLCKCWWERKGRKNLENSKFSATLWYMNMKNRFGWADKTETDNTHKVEVSKMSYENAKSIISRTGSSKSNS